MAFACKFINDSANVFTAFDKTIVASVSEWNEVANPFAAASAAIISGVNNLNPCPPFASCLMWNIPLIM